MEIQYVVLPLHSPTNIPVHHTLGVFVFDRLLLHHFFLERSQTEADLDLPTREQECDYYHHEVGFSRLGEQSGTLLLSNEKLSLTLGVILSDLNM